MAGTLPHAVFVETGLDGGTTAAAYAAELPGCATFAPGADEAAAAIPLRVARFIAWLASSGEEAPQVVGDNWYEVERGAAGAGPGERATFTLDELPPSDEEWTRWLGWLEIAREELAAALDEAVPEAAERVAGRIADQDMAFVEVLGVPAVRAETAAGVDRCYAARDALTNALAAAGPSADGVRRILRVAIADDLRGAAALRGGEG